MTKLHGKVGVQVVFQVAGWWQKKSHSCFCGTQFIVPAFIRNRFALIIKGLRAHEFLKSGQREYLLSYTSRSSRGAQLSKLAVLSPPPGHPCWYHELTVAT